MNSIRTLHVRIEGRVQGVGYRAWTERTASSIGFRGWVRNRRDGAVELMLQGSDEDVAEMLRLSARGPPGAYVSKVDVVGEGAGAYDGFEIRPTV
jgi:acylphosphatase